MATKVECVIDTGGAGDYPSHNAAEAGNYGAGGTNLVAMDKTVHGRCQATTGAYDTAGVTVGGFTVNATHMIQIETDLTDTGGDGQEGSFRHKGVKPAVGAKIYVHKVAGTAITTTVQFCEFLGLVIWNTTVAANYMKGIYIAASGTCDVRLNLLISDANQTGYYGPFGITIEMTGGGAHVASNTIYGYAQGTNASGMWLIGYGPASHALYANTVTKCKRGIWRNDTAGSVIAKNNVCFGNTDDYAGSALSAGSVNNAFSEGADPGTDGLDLSGYTGAQVFLDYAGNDFHITGTSPLRDAGIDLSTDPVYPTLWDIDTEARPNDGYDIGSDEYQPPPQPLQCYQVDMTESEEWMRECLRPLTLRRLRRWFRRNRP